MTVELKNEDRMRCSLSASEIDGLKVTPGVGATNLIRDSDSGHEGQTESSNSSSDISREGSEDLVSIQNFFTPFLLCFALYGLVHSNWF